MFRAFSKTPARRLLHTASNASRPVVSRLRRVGIFALGAGAATAYLAWSSSIALDSAQTTPSSKPSHTHSSPLTPKSSVSPDVLSSSHSTAIEHEPSLHETKQESPFLPEETSSSDDASSTSAAEGSEEKPAQTGGGGGAYNPETGEINWDCPCLGGMAHGPCGMEFREAFSCFIYSEQEPKGIDCVEKFKAMQNCFREHPDVYGDEIMDDDDDDEDDAPVTVGAAAVPVAQSEVSSEVSSTQLSEPTPAPRKKRTSQATAAPETST